MAVVAIGQQIGSQGLELGRAIAERMRYPLVSAADIIPEAARRYNFKASQFDLIDKRQPRLWERLMLDSVRLYTYFRATAMRHIASSRVVIVGRSIPCMIPADTREVLKVRVVAPLNRRVERVMGDEKLERAAAERRVQSFDQEMRAWIARLMQGVDIEDSSLYDLAVNTSARPIADWAQCVVALLRPIEQASDEVSRHALADACINAQVRAALMAHPKIGHAPIAVATTAARVTLRSAALVPPWDELALAVVRQVDGVGSVSLEVEEPPPPIRTE